MKKVKLFEEFINEVEVNSINEYAKPEKITAKGRNWDVGVYNHHHFGEQIAFRFMANDKMIWHLDNKVSKERQNDLHLSNMGDLQGKAYFPKEKYDVKRLAKEMIKVVKKAEDDDPMNWKSKRGGFYQDKEVVLKDYVKALEAWVELRDSMGIANESLVVNESAIDTLADEIDDAKVYDASSDGDSVDARSTKKTWDDGVPVLKYIARAPKKSVKLPKKFKVVDDTKYGWWYFQVGNTWYGIEQDDYGTPPFEY